MTVWMSAIERRRGGRFKAEGIGKFGTVGG